MITETLDDYITSVPTGVFTSLDYNNPTSGNIPSFFTTNYEYQVINEKDIEMFSVRYSPDGTLLVAGCGDGSLRVYSTKDGKQLHQWNTAIKQSYSLPVTCIKFKPIGSYNQKNIVLVAGSKGKVQHWHLTSGRCVSDIEEDNNNQVFVLDYSTDGKNFATAGKDSMVRVYDDETRTLLRTMQGGNGINTAGHTNRIFSLKCHPNDSNVILTGGWDNTVQMWDTRVDHAVRRIFGPHICGDSIDIDVNGAILTGSWRPNDQIQLWDYGTGKLIQNMPVPSSGGKAKLSTYCSKFNGPSGTLIGVGGSGTNEALLMARTSGKIVGAIRGLEKSVYSLTFSPDQSSCAVGTADGSIFILQK
ncbi:hypothetical protein ABK040_000564 [Willaertia magna]